MMNPEYTVHLQMPKKRGRPAGVKNKLGAEAKKAIARTAKSVEAALEEWDMDLIDWEAVAKKQEEKLTMYLAENDELARICVQRWDEIQNLKYLVKYLEGRHEDTSV